MVALTERASLALGRLDARISDSPVGSAWQLRAAWTGYATALRLQGHEVDEIDVFSWGCALSLPGRPRLSTLDDPFADFACWQAQFAGNARRHWRDDLGALVEADPSYGGPRLLRALEAVRQIAMREPAIDAWLSLPLLLQRMTITRCPLPCLVVGEKRLRFGQPTDEAVLRRLLKSCAEAADTGLERLYAIERDRLRAARTIQAASRPGALPRLLTRLQAKPMVGPQTIAREFGLGISGAGKLLARAAHAGLVREVRGTRAWKVYITPDLAVTMGLAAPARGRPRRDAAPLLHDRDLSDVLAAFDAEMASLAPLLPSDADHSSDFV